jgi:hypothetical protein
MVPARSHSPRAISGSAAFPASMLPSDRSRPMLRATSIPARATSTASSLRPARNNASE